MQAIEFGKALLFVAAGLGFAWLASGIGRLVAPRRPSAAKNSAYECGEEPLGTPWVQFQPRFLHSALLFLVFEAEVLLLWPWALRLGAQTTWALAAAGLVFMLVLAIGLAWAWHQGDLQWLAAPRPATQPYPQTVPQEAYVRFNEQMQVKPVPVPAVILPPSETPASPSALPPSS